jgi:hypothetical protein
VLLKDQAERINHFEADAGHICCCWGAVGREACSKPLLPAASGRTGPHCTANLTAPEHELPTTVI